MSTTWKRLAPQLLPKMREHVRASFPRMCPGLVDDAVSSAFEQACLHSERIEGVREQGGDAAVYRLMRVIAWRQARRGWQRTSHGTRAMCPLEAGAYAVGHAPGQIVVLDVLRTLEDLPRLARSVSERHADRLVEAVHDKWSTGDSDGVVAERHGVRREYVNRVKRLAVASAIGERVHRSA